MPTEWLHCACRQDLVQHRARACVSWWVSFKNDAQRTPWLLLGEITQAHPPAGAERDGVVENGMYFGVAGNCIDAPLVAIDERARFTYLLMCRKRIGEKLD